MTRTTTLVGRDRELHALLTTFHSTLDTKGSRAAVLHGPAGSGRSRLIREMLATAPNDRVVLHSRCLDGLNGATFWPLARLVEQACSGGGEQTTGDNRTDLERLLSRSADRDDVADRLHDLLGWGPPVWPGHELFWGVLRLLEEIARARPVVVWLEDVEERDLMLLQMMTYLASRVRGPVLILAEVGPWFEGDAGSPLHAIEVGPLALAEASQLANELLPGPRAADIASASQGLPGLINQLALLAAELGPHDALPESLDAAVRARFESLGAVEREAVQAAAVASGVLTKDSADAAHGFHLAGSALENLVRAGFLSTSAALFGSVGFRFRHPVMAEVVARTIPDEQRGAMHARVVEWLSSVCAGTPQCDALIAHHSARSDARASVGEPGPVLRLVAVARRALERSDVPGAIATLEEAVTLVGSPVKERAQARLELIDALLEIGDADRAAGEWTIAREEAASSGDVRLVAAAAIAGHRLRMGEAGSGRRLQEVEDAAVVLAASEDHTNLARAKQVAAGLHWELEEEPAAYGSLTQALLEATRAARGRDVARITSAMLSTLYLGPLHVREVIEQCNAIAEPGHDRLILARKLTVLGGAVGMTGAWEEARALLLEARRLQEELGQLPSLGSNPQIAAEIELLAGDAVAAEEHLRVDYERLRKLGSPVHVLVTEAMLARCLHRQGRWDEADLLVARCRQAPEGGDPRIAWDWRATRARLLAERGLLDEAERAARDSVAVFRPDEAIKHHADSLTDLAEVLKLAGQPDEALASAERALHIYRSKGVLPAVKATSAMLEGWRVP